MPRLVDHPRYRPYVWWSGAPQEQSVPTLPELDGRGCDDFVSLTHRRGLYHRSADRYVQSMDVLGLLAGMLSHRGTLHWGFGKLWHDEGAGCTIARFGIRECKDDRSLEPALERRLTIVQIPEIVFCIYQMLFCACTVQIVIGGSFERGRIVPSLVFGFFWASKHIYNTTSR